MRDEHGCPSARDRENGVASARGGDRALSQTRRDQQRDQQWRQLQRVRNEENKVAPKAAVDHEAHGSRGTATFSRSRQITAKRTVEADGERDHGGRRLR